jgi:hypothetical protein
MAEDNVKKPEELIVMPVRGKYTEIIYDSKTYKIWRENPGTHGKVGTSIPYDAAVYFLGKTPPIITIVPVIQGGKHVSPLLKEDQEKIRLAQERGFNAGSVNYNKAPGAIQTAPVAGGSSEALTQALDLLAKQSDANKILQESLAAATAAQKALSDRLEKLESVKKEATPASPPPASPPKV